MSRYTNILLIEDDPDDKEFFFEALNNIDPDISCVSTASGYHGLHLLEKLPPFQTLIFLDLNMPMMSGLLFLEIVKGEKKFRDIPVVVLTNSQNDAARCHELGASLYLSKPHTWAVFQTILSIVIGNDVKEDGEVVQNLILRQLEQQM